MLRIIEKYSLHGHMFVVYFDNVVWPKVGIMHQQTDKREQDELDATGYKFYGNSSQGWHYGIRDNYVSSNAPSRTSFAVTSLNQLNTHSFGGQSSEMPHSGSETFINTSQISHCSCTPIMYQSSHEIIYLPFTTFDVLHLKSLYFEMLYVLSASKFNLRSDFTGL